MAQVGLAAPAFYFCAAHSKGIIGQVDNTGFADGGIEAGPSAAAFKFRIALKEGIATGGAIKGTHLFGMLKRAGAGSLSAFHPGDIIDIIGQDFLPFFVGNVHFGRVGPGINGVGGIFFSITHNYFFLVVGGLGIAAMLQKGCQQEEGEVLGYSFHVH